MPYATKKLDGKFAVVNTETGAVKAKATTKVKAEKQVKLLRGIEHGWKPTGTYREFIKKHFAKRPAGMCVRAWMVEGAKQWRELKNK